MEIFNPRQLNGINFDCNILVHPHITILESTSLEIQQSGIPCLNVGKELSNCLISIQAHEHSRYIQSWLMDSLLAFPSGPVLCKSIDILFEPSFKIDPLGLFRLAARVKPIIVLWPGDYSDGNLHYAVPAHHHFRTWRITDSLLHNPEIRILQLQTN